jgi:hypothetical protein
MRNQALKALQVKGFVLQVKGFVLRVKGFVQWQKKAKKRLVSQWITQDR